MEPIWILSIFVNAVFIVITIPILAIETKFFDKLGDVLKVWLSPKVALSIFAIAFMCWQLHKFVKAHEVRQANTAIAYEKLSNKE